MSHHGGEKFSTLLRLFSEGSDAAIAAQRVLAKLSDPFEVEMYPGPEGEPSR